MCMMPLQELKKTKDNGGKLWTEDMKLGSSSPLANTFKYHVPKEPENFKFILLFLGVWKVYFSWYNIELSLSDSSLPWFKISNNPIMNIYFYSKCRVWMEPILRKQKESEVAQSCPTLCHPVDCSPPGSSIHGVFQARILEWVSISLSRGSSQPRDWTQVFRLAGRRFNLWDTREARTYL